MPKKRNFLSHTHKQLSKNAKKAQKGKTISYDPKVEEFTQVFTNRQRLAEKRELLKNNANLHSGMNNKSKNNNLIETILSSPGNCSRKQWLHHLYQNDKQNLDHVLGKFIFF